YAWECAFGRSPSREEIDRLDRNASAVIPNIEVDSKPAAELCMRSSVGVLETLDCLRGVEGAAVRACSGVLDALVVAQDLIGGEDKLGSDSQLFDAIRNGDRIPPLLVDELALQGQMIEDASTWTDGRLGLVWREEHRRRGALIFDQIRERLFPR